MHYTSPVRVHYCCVSARGGDSLLVCARTGAESAAGHTTGPNGGRGFLFFGIAGGEGECTVYSRSGETEGRGNLGGNPSLCMLPPGLHVRGRGDVWGGLKIKSLALCEKRRGLRPIFISVKRSLANSFSVTYIAMVKVRLLGDEFIREVKLFLGGRRSSPEYSHVV